MIDWSKRNVCDSCDALSSQKHPVRTYTFTLNRTGKTFTLCEDCVKELSNALQEIMKGESE